MKKTKYILKKLIIIFFIACISIFIYEFFMVIKNSTVKNENYGTKLSADENIDKTKKNITNVIENVSNAVVGISKIKNIGSSIFLSDSAENLGLGTGIIVSKNGYIITNQHVVGNNISNCYVTVKSGKKYKGKIVWANADIDLAVIKVDEIFKNVANLGNSNSINVGNTVYAIGNPIGYEFQRTVTGGIISAINRTVKIKNEDERYSYMANLIQTDATINPGNSGGPLIDNEGNIIGINTIKITTAEGIGFAIPINVIKPIIEKYNKVGEFKEAYLGIFAYDGSIMPYIDKNINLANGVYVEEITRDGPASKSELAEGDIIIKVDNSNINKMSELYEYIFSKNPGDEITLTILRKNKEKNIKVILEEKTLTR